MEGVLWQQCWDGHQRAHAVSTVHLSISVQLSGIDFA